MPAKRSRKMFDQATVNPQLAGRSGVIVHSSAPASRPSRRRSRAAASLRRRAPAPSRRVSTARGAVAAFETDKCPSSSQPVQRWRSANCTPMASSRRSHARSSGEALNACGKTRPLEPTKVGCPSASPSRAKRAAEMLQSPRELRRRFAVAREERRQRFAVGQIKPAAPRHQEFSARRGHCVIDGDGSAAVGEHSRPPSVRPDRHR